MSSRPTDPLLVESAGHRAALLGNEAIVRAAIECGVGFASGYPGTPSSEITDSFARMGEAAGVCFEYSVNEKIAVEMAYAASLAGARSICAMKHLGLMSAGDPITTIPYVGPVAGMVIVSAGDPSCRTSPNEHDQRYLGPMLHMPVLDPASPLEAYEMTRFAFELSEQCSLPVLLRITTRVCHTRGVIHFGPRREPRHPEFVRDPKRFVPIPINARRLRGEITDRMHKAQRMIADSRFFSAGEQRKRAVISSGAPSATCTDLLRDLGLQGEVMHIRLGAVHPLPESQIVRALHAVETALVVEELSPFVEDALASICSRHRLPVTLLGKRSGHLPVEFEYEPQVIRKGLHQALELGSAPEETSTWAPVPPRPPSLCPSCPHRSSQFALRAVFGADTLYFNDIGCYTLGYGEPLETADALLCMGAGFTLAAGVARVTGQRTVGMLGDSTFFHSGMPALLNAVKEGANMVAVILDNQVTAMTGFQDSPTVDVRDGQAQRQVSIEGVVRALGVDHVVTADPADVPRFMALLEEARDATGVAVVIAQRPCPVFDSRIQGKAYQSGTYAIDPERCQNCGRESKDHRCQQSLTRGYEANLARACASNAAPGCSSKPAEAPCSTRCPVGLCVQGYIGHIAAGEYAEAQRMILEQLPLPDSVCRVCHRPCEEVCTRSDLDEPIAINDLKRFVADWATTQDVPYQPRRDPSSGKRVAVIGAGPTGLAAAHDLVLRGHAVRLFDADTQAGGLLRRGIAAYRLPDEAVQRDVQRVLDLGVDFVGGRVLGRDLNVADLLTEGYDAVLVAIGAHKGFSLELQPCEDGRQPRILDALDYLKHEHDAPPDLTNKKVVIVGGGNSAIDAARSALRHGAVQVSIAYRRSRAEMPALGDEIAAAEAEGVRLLTLMQPCALSSGGLRCQRTKLGEPDASGRRRPVVVDGSETSLDADVIIAAVGQAPDDSALDRAGLDLRRRRDGCLDVDPETGQTSDPRVFAGGDVCSTRRTVTDAIAWGKRSAWGLDRVLRGHELADRRPPPPQVQHDGDPARPSLRRLAKDLRRRPHESPSDQRTRSFDEVVRTLDEASARAEARRCLICGQCGNCRSCIDMFGCPAFFVDEGRVRIDPALCNGCGVCVSVCSNGAIYAVDQPGQHTHRCDGCGGQA